MFYVATSVVYYLHACPRPTHQTIASCLPGAPTSAICPFFRYQDPCLVRCGISCNVPTLFDCLLVALGMRQKCFVLVMAITALLFLGCLQIEFTRVPLHVLRTHIQNSRHLLRSVFVRFKQPMVSSPSSERKTRKCSCEETRTAARGRCVGLKPPLSQTTMKARIGHPWRDQTPSCSPSFSILAKVGATCSSCFICGRFAQQQTNKASSPPTNVRSMGYRAHALSPQ